MLKRVKRLVKKILSVFLGFVLNRHISRDIRRSALRGWTESGGRIPCPYCDSKDTKKFHVIDLDSDLSLFESDKNRLRLYYGEWLPDFIWDSCGWLRTVYMENSAAVLKHEQKIDYLKCGRCDLVFQNYPHKKERVNAHYSRYYRRGKGKLFGRANSPDSHHPKWKALVAGHFLETARLTAGSKVLDVGCAEGCFCKALEERGISGYGIDPSEAMTAYAGRILELENIKCDGYGKNSYIPGYFDAIHCFHVFEHVPDIQSTLEAMSLHLRDGGVMALSVPCVDLVEKKEDLARILCSDHIYNFSEKWFNTNLSGYGFKIFSMLKTPFDIGEFGDENPGREFGVSPWGDTPGGMYIFARKMGRGGTDL
jgi:2-polyprenyl-3-methyl-5-hydroxy-6-metoxy-1,4-benzoquinol methylase